MIHLRSNQELYDYLVCVWRELKTRGATELAEAVAFAIGNAAGLSTEFLGESRIALQRLALEGKELLSADEIADLEEILTQLAAALPQPPQRR
jgi:hypothetical protein